MIDPFFSSVALLLHCDDGDATTVRDVSPLGAVLARVGSIATTTAVPPKFGLSSIVGAAASCFNTPSSAATQITGDFTYECWIFQSTAPGFERVFAGGANGPILWFNGAVGQMIFGSNPVGGGVDFFSGNLNTWIHVAMVRQGETLTLFKNGVSVASGISSFNQSVPTKISVGAGDSGGMQAWRGNIDEFRVTMGVARYTSDFTPQDAEFYWVPNSVDLALPMLALTADLGAFANVGLPMLTAVADIGVAADKLMLPMMRLAADMGGSAAAALPMFELDAAGHDSTGENAFDGVLSMMTLTAHAGASASLVLPLIALDAAVTGTALIQVDLTIPMLALDASGVGSPFTVTADLAIPRMAIESYFGGGAQMALPLLSLDASITAGGLLTAALTIPMIALDAAGTRQNYGSIVLTLPMLVPMASATADLLLPMVQLDAAITATVSVTYEAYSVNLTHSGENTTDEVTRYTNFPFERIVRYQNSYFGMAADGLYLLEGTTDFALPAPTAIPWNAKTAISDMGAGELKTVVSAYFGGRLPPAATVTLHVGEKSQHAYAYTTPRGPGVQNHREKFGRGLKTRYFALQVAGNGPMELDDITPEIQNMTRRI